MKLRVCAYCRVSTDSEDQRHSLASQRAYFAEYIRAHADWELVAVYADEGLSGTSVKHRAAFGRMLSACRAGEIDLILTKEVSRFARNTVDTLQYTRELARYGVGVVFIGDGIDTRAGDGEFRLSIMASVAQEESRKTSERVKWGQRRSMERGVVFGNDTTYGFATHQGMLTVREEQAAVVRRVYGMCLYEGKGTSVIARELTEAGVPTPKPDTAAWSGSMVLRMLRNEKYVGDLRQRKYVTTDFLTHKKVINREEADQIYLRDHHPAIVERAVWEAVQAELDARAGRTGTRHSARYWCSGKVVCGACGAPFTVRRATRADGQEYRAWGCACRLGKRPGKTCAMRMVNERMLSACVRHVLGLFLPMDALRGELVAELTAAAAGAEDTARQHAALLAQRERILDAYVAGDMTREEMRTRKARVDAELAWLETAADVADDAWAAEAVDGVLAGPDALREVVETITVQEDALCIRLFGIPGTFRVVCTASGYKERYTVRIQSCTLVP